MELDEETLETLGGDRGGWFARLDLRQLPTTEEQKKAGAYKSRLYYLVKSKDPEWMKEMAIRSANYARRNPEKVRAYHKKHYDKVMANPETAEAARERYRRYYRLKHPVVAPRKPKQTKEEKNAQRRARYAVRAAAEPEYLKHLSAKSLLSHRKRRAAMRLANPKPYRRPRGPKPSKEEKNRRKREVFAESMKDPAFRLKRKLYREKKLEHTRTPKP